MDRTAAHNAVSQTSLTQPLLGKEFVATNDLPAPVPPLKIKPIPFNASLAHVEHIRATHGVSVVPNLTKRINGHATLAYERNTVQHRLHRKLKDYFVCDVGGSPRRLKAFNRAKPSIFHLCPQLQAGDQRRASGGNKLTTCTHTLEQHLDLINTGKQPHKYVVQLQHGENCCDSPATDLYHECHVCQVPDTYVFCHSAYYMSPETLVRAIRACRLKSIFVIGHVFDTTPGNHAMYDQARYSMGHNGEIVYQANGNRHLYRHKPLPWNSQPTFTVDGCVFEATERSVLGFNHVWQVAETTYPMTKSIPIPLDWRKLVTDTSHVGEIQTTLDDRLVREFVNEPLNIKFNRFVGAGPFLVAFDHEQEVRVPRGAISAVASAVVGKERNPITFNLAVQTARGYMRTSVLPVEEQPRAIIVSSLVGFSLHLDFEVNMIDTARYKFHGWWQRHAASLKLGALSAIPMIGVIAFVMFVDFSSIVLDVKTSFPDHPFLIAGAILTCGLMLTIACVYCIHNRQQADLAASFGEVRLHDGIGVDISDPLLIPSLQVPPGRKFTPLLDLEEGASISVGPDPKPPLDPPKPTLEASGFIVPNCMPVTAPSTQEAEIVAIRNRVLAKNPFRITEESNRWYNDVFKDHPSFKGLWKIRIDDNENAFQRWIGRSPYNETERQRLGDIWRRVQSAELPVKQGIKAHVKSDEKLLKTGFIEQSFTPRIISASSDEHKVATGPFMWNFSNDLAKEWDGKDNMIYYVRGSTAEDVGAWFKECLEELWENNYADIFAIEDDFEKFDSSVTEEHKEPVREVYISAGASEKCIDAFENEAVSGHTRHGVSYKSDDDQIASGRNSTNTEGSMVNGAAHVAAIEPILHPKRHDRMALNGDDNLIARDRKLMRWNDSEEVMTEKLRNMGLRPTIRIRNHVGDVEFCSKIFLESARYPGKWVLSPKPGRAIAKLGWTFVQSGNTLRADALSMSKDSAHVPFLRHVVRRTLELATPTSKKGKRKHTWEWEIHASDYHDRKDGVLPDSTWAIFYHRYGLTQADERHFEECINAIISLPAVIPSTTIGRLQEVDQPC
jgi:hypothetical protein